MNVVELLVATGLSLLFLVAVFRPLELAFPSRPGQRFLRPMWATDLCYLLGQYLLFNGVVFWALAALSPWIHAATPEAVRGWVGSLSGWAQLVLVILVGDVLIYWGHRLQHRVAFLWRFHSVHHSAEHLDWLAAHREHPLDSLYTILIVNLPIFALGFPIESLASFAAFRGLWAIFIHANVRFPLPRLMRVLIGAPELHHWHHDRDRDAGNYANVSPLMDVIFRTYTCPDAEPQHVGVNEPMPRTYLGQLLNPFRRTRYHADRADARSTSPPIRSAPSSPAT